MSHFTLTIAQRGKFLVTVETTKIQGSKAVILGDLVFQW